MVVMRPIIRMVQNAARSFGYSSGKCRTSRQYKGCGRFQAVPDMKEAVER